MDSTSDMMADINKYADIWEKALKKGIFDDAPKPPAPAEPEASADFFGQLHTDEYDMDSPLNEAEVKYWKELAKDAADRSSYYMPLNEEKELDKEAASKMASRLGSTFNPVYPNTAGKDQDIKVTQNWGVGGKELNDLEDLKKRLHELEVKLNTAGILPKKGKKTKNEDENTIQKSINDLKKQIDQLSDELNGSKANES